MGMASRRPPPAGLRGCHFYELPSQTFPSWSMRRDVDAIQTNLFHSCARKTRNKSILWKLVVDILICSFIYFSPSLWKPVAANNLR